MLNHYTPGKYNALFHGKCPRCRSGKIFKFNAIGKNFMKMNDDCPVCGLHFEIETGFFWGAMYLSYAITCAMLIILGGSVLIIGHDPDFWIYMAVIIPSFFIASPFTFRYARILLLYWFSSIRFEEQLARK